MDVKITKIKDEYGRIIGKLEDDGEVVVAKDFYGRILGKYRRSMNKTFDFYGRIVGKGDVSSGLVWENHFKKQNGK